MPELRTYAVQLHNRTKRHKWTHITKCVSPTAACRVADLKEMMRTDSKWNPYWSTNAWELDDEGNMVY